MQYLEFNKSYTKKLNSTRIEGFKFNWNFIGFPQIININDLYSFINNQLKTSLNKKQEDDLAQKISDLRALVNQYFKKIEEYMINWDNILNNFFIKIYTLIRDFINNILISYIFFSHIHEDIKYKNNFYDIDDYYLWQYQVLEFEVLKSYIQLLKSINGKLSNFEAAILTENKKLSIFKSNIKKYHYSIII